MKTAELPVAGWSCNRCNQFHAGERIPNRCASCIGVEFRIEHSAPAHYDLQPIACPDCHYTGDLDSFECLGADDGNIFCPKCSMEFPVPPLMPVVIQPSAEPVQQSLFESEGAA